MKKWSEFTFYILAVLLLSVKTILVYFFEFDLRSKSFLEIIFMLINPIGSITFLLGISFFFSKKFRRTLMLVMYTILTGILFGNILYYRFYIDYVTVPVLFQFQNVGGLSQSTVELLRWTDPLLIIDLLFLIWFGMKFIHTSQILSKKQSRASLAVSIMMILTVLVGGEVENPSLYKKTYDRELLVKTIGTFNYHAYDILFNSKMLVQSAFAESNDIHKVENYLKKENNSALSKSEYHGQAKGKNLILISLESTQSFVLNRKINGEEITPFLNKLIKESYYFPNFYHQTAQGKTSDAEFMIDNGLYPLSGGSVFVRRPHNDYYALPKILKEQGYYSAVFHSNDETFWNRGNMYQTLGYDRFFSKKDYEVSNENSVNYGLKDIPFFQQSMPYLKNIPQPFYAKFLTLTNHFPFLLDNKDDLYLSIDENNADLVHRYFATVRYEDEAIKKFFQMLKKEGLYNNSIIVLYGDHYGISKSYDQELEAVLGKKISNTDQLDLQKVPFIIHVPGERGKQINSLGGEIDIRQTIFDIMGVEPQKEAIDFGRSLFSTDQKNLVIFRDGSFVTNKYAYLENGCYRKTTGEKVKRNLCTSYQDKVQNELMYSDNVIFGDLLRFLESDGIIIRNPALKK
ncbi:LTA synthase family protein [Bacillus sp. FJAT-49736]|uniref:LTA synthase family protein n=1 Tax=Bacillus sp. FJAT-49736 TaxID=2833582 RepID=UPI001BCA4155|nr:LTA synthase family protein [Bacillus sp. FJAT-49736]MBS4173859.1 LTA synthase family protein [Bacillus sp. FJAT-49736]